MRLLVVDVDRRLGELIRSVAARDGHQVWVAESAAQAVALGERHQPEVILGALELGSESGLAPLRTLRDTLPQTPDIILSSATRSRYDPRVQAAMDALQARDFFRQPLSVLDLMDMLRRLAAPAPGAAPEVDAEPAGRVLWRSLVKLTQIWSGRLSGVLSFTDRARTRRELPFSDGAPVRRADLATLRRALYEGSLDFERQEQRGTGLRSALAELLWGVALDPEKQSFARHNLYKALVITASPEVVFSLPLDPQTRRLLQRVDRALLLGELLPTSASAGDSVISSELSALERMRLIAMQMPVHRRRVAPAGPPEPPRSADSRRTPTRPVPTPRVSQSTILDSTVALSSSRFSSRGPSRRSMLSPKQISRMIAQDIERMPRLKPADILMVTSGADEQQLKKAARRLVRRYRQFAENRALTDEERRHARHLQQIIVNAYKRLSAGDNTPMKKSTQRQPASCEELLAEGVRLIHRHEWADADALLSRAQALDAMNPIIMSHLGWARLHNPRIDAGARTRDGFAQISLAYQLRPDHPDVCYYMAEHQVLTEQLDVALQLTEQARRGGFADSRFVELERRIAQARAAQPGD